jgi:hypothetical protein
MEKSLKRMKEIHNKRFKKCENYSKMVSIEKQLTMVFEASKMIDRMIQEE